MGREGDRGERGEGTGEGERIFRLLPDDRRLPSVSTMCSSASDISDPLWVSHNRQIM